MMTSLAWPDRFFFFLVGDQLKRKKGSGHVRLDDDKDDDDKDDEDHDECNEVEKRQLHDNENEVGSK